MRTGIATVALGSPPHTRGTPKCGLRSWHCVWDHPRIHGEHQSVRPDSHRARGSPPHTRGTQHLILHGHTARRITPAYTGNTGTSWKAKSTRWDHPRIHGEHKGGERMAELYRGSPPHTRGTQTTKQNRNSWYRITPAYTGNTQSLYDLHVIL